MYEKTYLLLHSIEWRVRLRTPSYAGDHHIDRITIMREEPVDHCILIIRENGTQFYNLTRKNETKEEWNQHIQNVLSEALYWCRNSKINGIYSYCFGHEHTICDYGKLERGIEDMELLIMSFEIL